MGREIERELSGRRAAVFLDYDGTLTPIVDRPDLALLSDGMRDILHALAARCSVAVISGRGLDDAAVRTARLHLRRGEPAHLGGEDAAAGRAGDAGHAHRATAQRLGVDAARFGGVPNLLDDLEWRGVPRPEFEALCDLAAKYDLRMHTIASTVRQSWIWGQGGGVSSGS